MNRRTFLLGTTALPLSACGLKLSPVVIGVIATDVSIVAAGMQSVLRALTSIPGVPAAIVASVGTYVAGIQSVAAAIASVPAGSPATTVADKLKIIEGFVNAIIAALAALAFIPPPISTYLVAASILLPVVEAAAGLVASMLSPPPSPVPVASPEQARVVLSS